MARTSSRSPAPRNGSESARPRWRRTDDPIRIGVSRCLLGDPVRFDGGHKRSRFVTDALGPFVEWVPVCPELEVGMDVPRPAIRIVQPEGTTGEDAQHLEALARYMPAAARALTREDDAPPTRPAADAIVAFV
ncbi:MAG TPA: DUF523 domain-containing protein, partial [Alphaproteobacteria bacterium]|nr:DUF523 domain-containing protein [Alphaproteobacteria bacterium]